ncbi:hypothetical protein DFJ74DRAFT_417970 [Hyaloraphidium curvatum]|nr:hypothetical protein DFJ74DRAFT_417970 [Hyaloraphidium curvatum]
MSGPIISHSLAPGHRSPMESAPSRRPARSLLPPELWRAVLCRTPEPREVGSLARTAKVTLAEAADDAFRAEWLLARFGRGESVRFLLFELPRLLATSARRAKTTSTPPIMQCLTLKGAIVRRGDLQAACRAVSNRLHSSSDRPRDWVPVGADLSDADGEVVKFLQAVFALCASAFPGQPASLYTYDLKVFMMTLGYGTRFGTSHFENPPDWPPERDVAPGYRRSRWQLSRPDEEKLRSLVFNFNLSLLHHGRKKLATVPGVRTDFSADGGIAPAPADWLAWDLAVSENSCFQALCASRNIAFSAMAFWACAVLDITALYVQWGGDDDAFEQVPGVTAVTSSVLSEHHEAVLDAFMSSHAAALEMDRSIEAYVRMAVFAAERRNEYAARDACRRLFRGMPGKGIAEVLAAGAARDGYRMLALLVSNADLFAEHAGFASQAELEETVIALVLDGAEKRLASPDHQGVANAGLFPFKWAVQKLAPGFRSQPGTLPPTSVDNPTAMRAVDLAFSFLDALCRPFTSPEGRQLVPLELFSHPLDRIVTDPFGAAALSLVPLAGRGAFEGAWSGIASAIARAPCGFTDHQKGVMACVGDLVARSRAVHKAIALAEHADGGDEGDPEATVRFLFDEAEQRAFLAGQVYRELEEAGHLAPGGTALVVRGPLFAFLAGVHGRWEAAVRPVLRKEMVSFDEDEGMDGVLDELFGEAEAEEAEEVTETIASLV